MILCEPKPRWAVLLRRFAPAIGITEARSLVLADDELRANPDSFVVVAASVESGAAVVLKLSQWQREFPHATVVILLDRPDADFDLALREVGAQLVVDTLFDLPLLARMAARHVLVNASA
jgi:hypothetical protein